MNYIISLKNGTKFRVSILDYDLFLKSINPSSKYYSNTKAKFTVCLEDISAIFPERWESK